MELTSNCKGNQIDKQFFWWNQKSSTKRGDPTRIEKREIEAKGIFEKQQITKKNAAMGCVRHRILLPDGGGVCEFLRRRRRHRQSQRLDLREWTVVTNGCVLQTPFGGGIANECVTRWLSAWEALSVTWRGLKLVLPWHSLHWSWRLLWLVCT